MLHQRLHRGAHGLIAVLVIAGSLALLGCPGGDDNFAETTRLDPATTRANVTNTNAAVFANQEISIDGSVFPFQGDVASIPSTLVLTNFRPGAAPNAATRTQADFTLTADDGSRTTYTGNFETRSITGTATVPTVGNTCVFTPTVGTVQTIGSCRMAVGTLAQDPRDVPIGSSAGIQGTLQLTAAHPTSGVTATSTAIPVTVAVFDIDGDGILDAVVSGINTGIDVILP
jgi:hypothetical protein